VPALAVSPAVEEGVVVVRSPMVGTFYSAPAPDQPPYGAVGKAFKEGDVLCIIEAMKLMNEIKSEAGGVITEILVQNGQTVEYDQPIMKIKKA
jgi:acetyl-CoA carboxylase biotin carboxyl carrier protein